MSEPWEDEVECPVKKFMGVTLSASPSMSGKLVAGVMLMMTG